MEISLLLDESIHGDASLTIFAYNLNLSEYLTANLSIKPNIFQAPLNTVEGGYGCFGSLNLYQISISP